MRNSAPMAVYLPPYWLHPPAPVNSPSRTMSVISVPGTRALPFSDDRIHTPRRESDWVDGPAHAVTSAAMTKRTDTCLIAIISFSLHSVRAIRWLWNRSGRWRLSRSCFLADRCPIGHHRFDLAAGLSTVQVVSLLSLVDRAFSRPCGCHFHDMSSSVTGAPKDIAALARADGVEHCLAEVGNDDPIELGSDSPAIINDEVAVILPADKNQLACDQVGSVGRIQSVHPPEVLAVTDDRRAAVICVLPGGPALQAQQRNVRVVAGLFANEDFDWAAIPAEGVNRPGRVGDFDGPGIVSMLPDAQFSATRRSLRRPCSFSLALRWQWVAQASLNLLPFLDVRLEFAFVPTQTGLTRRRLS